MTDEYYIKKTIEFAKKGMANNEGGPFGAIIVKDDKIVGRGNNKVTSLKDPTAHAEIVAIRDACKNLNSFQLDGCVIYSSCEPCPMCWGAIYWARPDRLVFASSKDDASKVGFDDSFIYEELDLPVAKRKIETTQIMRDEANILFEIWSDKDNKIDY